MAATNNIKECIYCNQLIRQRQQGILCDSCNRWQHRTCNTGVTLQQYRDARSRGEAVPWKCNDCANGVPSLEELTDANLGPYEMPSRNEEESIGDITPQDILDDDMPQDITYEVIPKGTERGCPLLVDSMGYKYTIKKPRKNGYLWNCSRRGRTNPCQATVLQNGNTFIRGKKFHVHQGKPGIDIAAKVSVAVKKKSVNSVHTSAATIVEDVVLKHGGKNITHVLPKLDSLARKANRHREAVRPKDPTNFNFELDITYIPANFHIKTVIMSDGTRHDIFATKDMLTLLSKAKTWYCDGKNNQFFA